MPVETLDGPITAAAAYSQKPLLTLRPRAAGLNGIWAGFADLLRYRDLLVTLAARDVKLRYRQTALGALWVLLQPLVGAGLFLFVFGTVANLDTGGAPGFSFQFGGQLLWAAFAGTLAKTAGSLVGNSGLVSKVYFPRLALPLSTVLSTLVDFGIGLVVLLPVLLIQGVRPGWHLLTLPVWFALVALLATGVGLWAGALMVRYRDIQYVLPVATNFLLFASPVGWALAAASSHIPRWGQSVYLFLNPLASLFEAFRWSLFGSGGAHPAWGAVAYAAGVSLLAFFAGALVFRALERRFADVI